MSAQHTPTPDDMRLAALWLTHNEDDGTEGATCARVAAWLESQADAAELRAVAKENGVPVGKLRAAIAKATGSAS